MILEMDHPFKGLIKVSSAPLRYTLSQLGQQLSLPMAEEGPLRKRCSRRPILAELGRGGGAWRRAGRR